MKKIIVKVIAVFTLALALMIAGTNAINTADSGVAVCHDGPLDTVGRK